MSVQALSAALSFDVGDSTRKLVLLGLANHAHDDGTAAYAGVEKLAKYANCSARTVQRHIAKLLEDGFLREGDQTVIDPRIPARYRPIAYEVALSETIAMTWADERGDSGRRQTAAGHGKRGGTASAQVKRGDNLSPLIDGSPAGSLDGLNPALVAKAVAGFRGDNLSPLKPVDNSASGVTLAPVRGDTTDSSGVTPVSPKPSYKPSREPDVTLRDVAGVVDNSRTGGPAPASAPEGEALRSDERSVLQFPGLNRDLAPDRSSAAADGTSQVPVDHDDVDRVMAHLPDRLQPSRAESRRLRGLVVQRMERGWTLEAILDAVERNLRDGGKLENPCGLFAKILVPLEPPTRGPRQEASHHAPKAPWCGHCDEKTRFLLDECGFPDNAGPKCPECEQLAFEEHMQWGAS